jgi:CheY-like chemotaxis protein
MADKPCRVLVVDDNRDAADAAVMLLEMWGHEAKAAYSGAQCVVVAKEFDPDVVLMDIGLPDKHGFAVKRELETHCPAARIIALTGFSQADIVRRTRDAGFADHLIKPVETAELKDVVDHECAIAKAAP